MNPDSTLSTEAARPPVSFACDPGTRKILKVLHVEVGGSFGGSLRILETYLRHADKRHAIHDVLFYYPTPGAKALAGLVRNMFVLCAVSPREPQPSRFGSQGTKGARWESTFVGRGFSELRRIARIPKVLRTVRAIASLLQRENYDVVHVNNTFSYQAPTLLAAKWSKTPILAHVRNPVPPSGLNRALLRCADLVITMNRSLEHELRSWDAPVSVRTCRDGVELPAPDPSSALAWRTKLLPHGGFLVGSVGQLQPQKGFDDFIRAARLVIASNPDVHFAIAGSGPLQSSLESLISEFGLQDYFFLCGFQSDAASFLAALDLFVSSSHWEGGPLVVYEAMLLGKPVVATDTGWNRELIASEGTGKLVQPRDPRALATAIVESFASHSEMADRAEKNIPGVRQRSDPARSSRQTDAFIRALCGRERPH